MHDDDKRVHRPECAIGNSEAISDCDCPVVYEVISRTPGPHYLELTAPDGRKLVAPVGTPIPGPDVPVIPGLWIDESRLPPSLR